MIAKKNVPRGVALTVAVLALGSTGASQAPRVQQPSEAEVAAQGIEKALQRHGSEVHRCFEKALADTLDVEGKLEIEAEVGNGGKVIKANLVNGAASAPSALSRCVLSAAAGWTVDGIEPGASVVLPFAFQGQMNQYVVKSADVPERGPGAGANKKGPARGAAFTVKVLADAENVRATQLSVTLLTVGPASRVAMHRHPRSAKAMYLVKGRARILGPAGTAPLKLDAGSAVFVPAAYPHVIENMGRSASAVFVQAFVPPGPERVYRDPKDPQGRADFEVIRDAKQAVLPPPANGKLTMVSVNDAKAIPIHGGKGSAKILLEPAVTGSAAFALDVIELSPGADIPRHTHPGAAEVLYVLSGAGKLTVGSETMPFGTEEVIHIPADQPHGTKIDAGEKVIAIQIYAPAGPEQRFRAPAGTTKKAP